MNPVELSRELPLAPGVRMLNCNEDGLVALDKPEGVMSHPNEEKDRKRSLLTAHYDYKDEVFSWEVDGNKRYAWLINRLDSPTSGIILVALNKELAGLIKHEFATHKVIKIYYALCKDEPSSLTGNWNDTLKKSVYHDGCLAKNGASISAKTRYQVVKTKTDSFNLSLIKLVPLTGHTHQLRMQCRKHHHPIVGDRTYGNFRFNREIAEAVGVDRMLLHSGEISIRYVYKKKVRHFHVESFLPEAFNKVLHSAFSSSSGKKREEPERLRKESVLKGRRFKAG